mmetsp:Transcript_3517/g.7678  ORF Transcript_3517/g.7678 Transcript_3517/m.7678 type:complete len:280 (+) Transcript_3517:674-1513(+)
MRRTRNAPQRILRPIHLRTTQRRAHRLRPSEIPRKLRRGRRQLRMAPTHGRLHLTTSLRRPGRVGRGVLSRQRSVRARFQASRAGQWRGGRGLRIPPGVSGQHHAIRSRVATSIFRRGGGARHGTRFRTQAEPHRAVSGSLVEVGKLPKGPRQRIEAVEGEARHDAKATAVGREEGGGGRALREGARGASGAGSPRGNLRRIRGRGRDVRGAESVSRDIRGKLFVGRGSLASRVLVHRKGQGGWRAGGGVSGAQSAVSIEEAREEVGRHSRSARGGSDR